MLRLGPWGSSRLTGLKLCGWTRKRPINMVVLTNAAHDLGMLMKEET